MNGARYAVLIVYTDGKVGFTIGGDTVTSVTIGAVIHLVDPTREVVAIGVRVL